MERRWLILALVFAVRMNMGFQFQSIGALAPLVARDFAVNLADIGFLIGLYLAPGVFLSLPSGAIGRRMGDKGAVLLALVLMFAGGLLMALVPSWSAQVAGRFIAGIGGVLLNVVMTKVVTDWFAGREIATAMAIFVNSWPAGIALALVVMPSIGAGAGLVAVHLVSVIAIAAGFVAFASLYAPPPVTVARSGAATWPARSALAPLLVASLVWSLFNGAFAILFSFGTTLLTERGWSLAAAGSVTSVVMWLSVLSVPLGGLLADMTGRPLTVLVGGALAMTVLLGAVPSTDLVVPVFVALGLVSGLPAGPIMSLPSRVLQPETRALGMGLFYTLYYALTMIAPWLAGLAAARAGSAGAAFYLGAAWLIAGCLALPLFTRLASPLRVQATAR